MAGYVGVAVRTQAGLLRFQQLDIGTMNGVALVAICGFFEMRIVTRIVRCGMARYARLFGSFKTGRPNRKRRVVFRRVDVISTGARMTRYASDVVAGDEFVGAPQHNVGGQVVAFETLTVESGIRNGWARCLRRCHDWGW